MTRPDQTRPALLHTRATQHVSYHEKQIYIKVLRLHNKKQIYKRMTLHRHHEKHEAAADTTRLIITAYQSFHVIEVSLIQLRYVKLLGNGNLFF